MTLLEMLTRPEAWETFLQYKKEKGQIGKSQARQLEEYIREGRYPRMLSDISFGYPRKLFLSKIGTDRKRIVYCYDEDETWVLKHLAFLLYKYDDCLSGSCYSFRRNQTAKTAMDRILQIPDLEGHYVLKADIHDYFNSIDTAQLLGLLQEVITDDNELLALLKRLLTQDACISGGKVLREKRGAMAGVPLASFFANLYLRSLDEIFESRGIPYFRYSDDILIFARTAREREECFRILQEHLKEKRLSLNPSKVCLSDPGEPWEFLGFRRMNGQTDLSEASIRKMQGKIRRKAGRIYRWRKRKGASYERAAAVMIRSFDQKFYDLAGKNAFSWIRFYFPVLTTGTGLHRIDTCMQQYLRYLYSGRHYKGNYRISYESLKKLGYTPLVAEYYRWQEENRKLRQTAENI